MDSELELLKVANLTNRIKSICEPKTPVDTTTPFKLSSLRGLTSLGSDIIFDDAKTFSLSTDTDIVKSGTLEDISPTLSGSRISKQAYCDYLNEEVAWKGKSASTADAKKKRLNDT